MFETLKNKFIPELLKRAKEIHPNCSIEVTPNPMGIDVKMYDGKGDYALYFIDHINMTWLRVYG